MSATRGEDIRRLSLQVARTRLRLVSADMLKLRAGLAATMPGKMSALEEKLTAWAEATAAAERVIGQMVGEP